MSLSLQEISDRILIKDLLMDYAETVDSKNFDAWDDIFTPDAFIDYTSMGGPKGLMPDVRAWMRISMPRFPMSQHMLGNSRIRLDGDTAHVRTICYNPMQMPDGKGGYQIATFGFWYNDRLVRTSAGWRIAERLEEYGYAMNVPEGFEPDVTSEGSEQI